MVTLGTVKELSRYPIKSMQGDSPESVELNAAGIVGDRQFAFKDLSTGKIVSAKLPRLGQPLLTCAANLSEGSNAISVTIGSQVFDLTSQQGEINEAVSQLLDTDVQLVAHAGQASSYASQWPEIEGTALSGLELDLPMPDTSFADLAPIHALTTASLDHLAALTPESTITTHRFRPGVLIDTGEATGFAENAWPGTVVGVGTAELTFGAASPRCIMTTVAQPGLDKDTAILRSIASHNRQDFNGNGQFACLGIYAEVTKVGTVSVGDQLEVI